MDDDALIPMAVTLPPEGTLMRTDEVFRWLTVKHPSDHVTRMGWMMRVQQAEADCKLHARNDDGSTMPRHRAAEPWAAINKYFLSEEVAAWLRGEGYRITHRDVPTLATPEDAASMPPRKQRRNEMDSPIDRAIEEVGNRTDIEAIFAAIREDALNEAHPFTGETKDGRLSYTTNKNKRNYLDKDRLRQRLKPKRLRKRLNRSAVVDNGQ